MVVTLYPNTLPGTGHFQARGNKVFLRIEENFVFGGHFHIFKYQILNILIVFPTEFIVHELLGKRIVFLGFDIQGGWI